MKEITYAVIGYGGRGRTFANLISGNQQLFSRVVAVAEPDPERRALAAKECNLAFDKVFESASGLLAQPKLADAAIIATQDQMHAEQSISAMERGYHLLLEKPMAVTLDDCIAIEETQRKTDRVVCVCHSLRYHLVYANLKKMIESGLIGEIVSVDQLEGVGAIHQSSSFVRGPWANEEQSTFMLMAKSCHDVDLLSYSIGKKCERVSSFGSLTYFTPDNKPEGAPDRCLDGCPAEAECIYHCAKVYVESSFWRSLRVPPGQDDESLIEELRTSPYGRCVFACDNDVVDHQVVNFEYEGGATATFSMMAFTLGGRHIRVHGTRGYIKGDVEAGTLIHTDFITGNQSTTQMPLMEGSHGGGDYLVLRSVTEAIRTDNPSAVLTTAQESLHSHKIVFAAEKARREKRVVEIDD